MPHSYFAHHPRGYLASVHYPARIREPLAGAAVACSLDHLQQTLRLVLGPQSFARGGFSCVRLLYVFRRSQLFFRPPSSPTRPRDQEP